MYKIVFLRHGESLWNQENRFTGWQNIGLSEKGLSEAKAAGQLLKSEGYNFDLTYSSVSLSDSALGKSLGKRFL